MTRSEEICAGVQAGLTEAWLARRPFAAADLDHAGDCAACAAHRDDLRALAEGLAAAPEPELPDPAFAAARQRAFATLREEARRAPALLPEGYRREFTRILGRAAAALPLVVLWNLAVLYFGGALLADRMPPTLLTLLGGAYVVAAAGWLSIVYGAIPFVAHGQAQRRLQEVTS